MGSVVEYRCTSCAFTTGRLSIGWGKPGRQAFWGSLAACGECKQFSVVNLTNRSVDRKDSRCEKCNGLLTLFEGISVNIPCPYCRSAMRHGALETWA